LALQILYSIDFHGKVNPPSRQKKAAKRLTIWMKLTVFAWFTPHPPQRINFLAQIERNVIPGRAGSSGRAAAERAIPLAAARPRRRTQSPAQTSP
jgi:hypothetical protein